MDSRPSASNTGRSVRPGGRRTESGVWPSRRPWSVTRAPEGVEWRSTGTGAGVARADRGGAGVAVRGVGVSGGVGAGVVTGAGVPRTGDAAVASTARVDG